MAGRTNTNNTHRLAAVHSINNPNERYFPLRTNVSPGFARGSPSLSSSLPTSLPPQGGTGSYRDVMTIRAVSPDTEDGDIEGDETDDSLAAQHSPTTPPRTPSRSTNRSVSRFDMMMGRESPELSAPSSPGKSRAVFNRLPLSNFSQFADLGSSRAKSRSPTERAENNTISPPSDERPMTTETFSSSCSTFVARHRYDQSLSSSSTTSVHTSVGFPSTQSPTTIITKPNKSARQSFLRPKQSITTLSLQPASPPALEQLPSSPIIQAADASTLIKLMRHLRGKMEGLVEFRVGDNMVWTKGFCHINEDTGSLIHRRDWNSMSPASPIVIIPDLRGCQVRTPGTSAEEHDGIIEVSTHFSTIDIKLRPLGIQQYDYWLAALLCWQPYRPAGAQNKMVKPQTLVLSQERRMDRRRNSDAAGSRDAAIIKVGKMQLWRRGGPSVAQTFPGSGKGSTRIKMPRVAWQRISCTLQENGEFRLYAERDTILLTVIQLSQLSRCAVQQLDTSILDEDFCIAIYPQYTPSKASASLAPPVYLSIETRILFEVWFVLLRAFAMPELYGPAGMNTNGFASAASTPPTAENDNPMNEALLVNNGLADSYRIQRSLFLRVVEAKIHMPGSGNNGEQKEREKENLDCYAEVNLDGEVRAKTMVRTKTHNPFWREDYEFPDLPAVLSDISVILKQRDPRWKTKGSGTVAGSGGFGGGLGGVSVPGSRDAVIGRVDIQLDEMDFDSDTEGWWPLISWTKGVEEKVGEMFLKIGREEEIVLMADEYKNLSDLLHDFENGITMELAQVISADLRRLADTLLKIYQVSGKASDWLMALAEGEIDGLHKESPARLGINKNRSSNDSQMTSMDRDCLRRDLGRSALVDANILFRGNSLLTKALDAHMKRLGREYLEETLRDHLERIADDDTYCEVDPMRIESGENLAKNWKVLMGITRAIWQAIYSSPSRCPVELRRILKHIRACVEDRYGDFLRTVTYSSVCGFLFLRFFCPAILNPKLFGLLQDHPGVRAQRTLTLIAKSLQGLANMTTFGVKEPWMEPMNEFLSEHSAELKDFVDAVTTVPQTQYPQAAVPPSYATPNTIKARLPQSSKEGFPSLPYLIDQPRAFAALVTMWLKWYDVHRRKCPEYRLEGDLETFHRACLGIRDRIRYCVDKAENADRPSSSLSSRWEEAAEKLATQSPLMGNSPMWPTTQQQQQLLTGGSLRGHKSLGLYNSMKSGEEDVIYTLGDYRAVGGNTKSKISGYLGGFRKKVKSRGFVGGDDE